MYKCADTVQYSLKIIFNIVYLSAVARKFKMVFE